MKSFLQHLHENTVRLRDDGHYDAHGITPEHLDWLLAQPQIRKGKGMITLQLPDSLPPVWDSIVGPKAGDPPVQADDPRVYWASRGGGRNWNSRMIRAPHRLSHTITASVGVNPDGSRLLRTAYGGTPGSKELDDPTMKPDQLPSAREFWSTHALADGTNPK